jgi:hypothetical protein
VEQILQVELPVAVGQEDVVHHGSCEPGTDGDPVSAVSRMKKDLQLGDGLPDHTGDIAFLVETRDHDRRTHRAEPNSGTP